MQILLQSLSINANVMFVFYLKANSICFAQSMASLCSLCWAAQVCSSCVSESETCCQRARVTDRALWRGRKKQVCRGPGGGKGETHTRRNSEIYFCRSLALCVGFSFLIVSTKRKLGLLFIYSFPGKYTQKNTLEIKNWVALAATREHDPEPRLAPSQSPASPWSSSCRRGCWPERLLADTEVLRTTDWYSSTCHKIRSS